MTRCIVNFVSAMLFGLALAHAQDAITDDSYFVDQSPPVFPSRQLPLKYLHTMNKASLFVADLDILAAEISKAGHHQVASVLRHVLEPQWFLHFTNRPGM